MCQQSSNSTSPTKIAHNEAETGPFPWHVGVFDAHCHPTDIVESLNSAAAGMKAKGLTIMATRSQDQELVQDVAVKYPLHKRQDLDSEGLKIIPSFGWHPWFSYQLYDDSAKDPTYNSSFIEDKQISSANHYKAVLQPPPDDTDFLSSLPEPIALSSYISSLRNHLTANPLALVGEIGLDKACRLPQQWNASDHAVRDQTLTPGGREERPLSPYRISMKHQQDILTAQLRLAGETRRPVSVHGVQAHGILYDTISALWKGFEKEVLSSRQKKMIAPGAEEDESDEEDGTEPKPFPPRICLHSYSGGVATAKQWMNPAIPAEIYFSFSVAVNLSTDNGRNKFEEVVAALPVEGILVESDLHTAGEDMDNMLEGMVREVCKVRGWELEDGCTKLRANWERFVFGKQE